MIVFFFMFVALAAYIFGYNVGKWTTEEEIRRNRDEMGLTDEPEDELFKE